MQDTPQKPSEVSQRPQEFKEMNLGSGWRESGVDIDASRATSADRLEFSSAAGEDATRIPSVDTSGSNGVILVDRCASADQPLDDSAASSSGSPWYELRRDATTLVSQALQRGRKNFWQLMTSRVSVLLSSNAFCSTSIHQFLRNYEDLSVFVLAGEAFCGAKAYEFRNNLKIACESYYSNYHKQNIYVSLYLVSSIMHILQILLSLVYELILVLSVITFRFSRLSFFPSRCSAVNYIIVCFILYMW